MTGGFFALKLMTCVVVYVSETVFARAVVFSVVE